MIVTTKHKVLAFAAVALLAVGGLQATGTPTAHVDRTSVPPASPAPTPVSTNAALAERVVYIGGGARSWGTVCRIPGGFASVAHVTDSFEISGSPVVGPTDAVTARDELSDWSFGGVDPADLDHRDFPRFEYGESVTIAGFPARARTPEIVPGRVYTDDPDPKTHFWWIELLDSPAAGVPAEGVVGGISGSCVFNSDGEPTAVVSANGFSVIEGTTNTWAKVVPIRAAIRQAQGLEPEKADHALGLMKIPNIEMPDDDTGRWSLRGAE